MTVAMVPATAFAKTDNSVTKVVVVEKDAILEEDKNAPVLELDEVMNVSDRILVMYEGEIVGEFDPKATTVEELGLYMAGAKKQARKEAEHA